MFSVIRQDLLADYISMPKRLDKRGVDMVLIDDKTAPARCSTSPEQSGEQGCGEGRFSRAAGSDATSTPLA